MQLIADRYGSKKGFLHSCTSQLNLALGGYRQERAIDWSNVKRLIFICQGNICRSPFAEALAKRAQIETLSFGLNTTDSLPANPRAIRFSQQFAIDLTPHKTTRMEHYVAQPHDLVIAMEPLHLTQLKTAYPCYEGMPKTLLGLWAKSPQPYLHDPFNANDGYFNHCYSLIVDAVTQINRHLAKQDG